MRPAIWGIIFFSENDLFLPLLYPIVSLVKTCHPTKAATKKQKVRCPQLPKVGPQSGEGKNEDHLLSFTLSTNNTSHKVGSLFIPVTIFEVAQHT